MNFQNVDLALPGCSRVPSHVGELPGPQAMLFQIVVFPAVRLVKGILALFFGGNFVAPLGNVGRQVWGFGRAVGALSRRMSLVGFHATAGSVNDQGASLSRLLQHL